MNSDLPGAVTAMGSWLMLLLKWRTLISSHLVSALRYAIIDLVVGVAGVGRLAADICLGALPLLLTVAQVFASGGP